MSRKNTSPISSLHLSKTPISAPLPAASGKRLAQPGGAPGYDNKSKATQTQPRSIPGDPGPQEEVPTQDAIQMGTHHQLVTALSIDFKNEKVYCVPTGKHGPKRSPSDILIIGDTLNRPKEIFVVPEVQTVLPGQEILVQVCCMDLPFFLSKGTPIAQAFLLPKNHREQVPLNPVAMWAQVVGPSKPTLKCSLNYRGERTYLPGILDIGADVTIIARSDWPSHWDL